MAKEKEEKVFRVADLSKKLGTNDLRTRNILRAIDYPTTDGVYKFKPAEFDGLVGKCKAYIDKPRAAPPVKAKGPNSGVKGTAKKEADKEMAKAVKERKASEKVAKPAKAEKAPKAEKIKKAA